MREEPVAIPERVGVLGARRADGGEADVGDERVGADVLRHVDELDLGAIVDGPAVQEDLAALVEADAPARRDAWLGLHVERAPFELDHLRAEVGSIADETDETSHSSSSLLFVNSERADRKSNG